MAQTRFRSLSIIVPTALFAGATFTKLAKAVPFYGGPTYVAATTTGYQGGGAPPGGAFRDTIVMTLSKFGAGGYVGPRPFRWTAGGVPTELGSQGEPGNFGVDPSAFGMNSAGVAVGSTYTTNGVGAVKWDAQSTVPTVLSVGGFSAYYTGISFATAINAAGVITGYAELIDDDGLYYRPLRWSATGEMTELDHLQGDFGDRHFPNAINLSGTIVGSAFRNTGYFRPVRWNADGTAVIELSTLVSNSSISNFSAKATALNSSGLTIGYSEKPVADGPNGFRGQRAVFWTATSTVANELSNLGTLSNGYAASHASAVNDAGTIVGSSAKYANDTSYGSRPVRWSAAGTLTELGILGTDLNGSADGGAFALNAAGIAVGVVDKYVSGASVGRRAVAWGAGGVAVDLNTLLPAADSAYWTLTAATSISDTYWVSGNGSFDPDGAGPIASYVRAYMIDVISTFGTPGDATRDGRVNFGDLLILAQHYNQTTGQTWDSGDFNGDGGVKFDDLLILAQHYNAFITVSPTADWSASFAADWALSQSLVPEPTTLASIASAIGLMHRRRPAVKAVGRVSDHYRPAFSSRAS